MQMISEAKLERVKAVYNSKIVGYLCYIIKTGQFGTYLG